MTECPTCQMCAPQVKVGTTSAGRQRYNGLACQYKDTPTRKRYGYPPAGHRKAVQEYVDGRTLRQVAR